MTINKNLTGNGYVSDFTKHLNLRIIIDYEKQKFTPDIKLWFVSQSSSSSSSSSSSNSSSSSIDRNQSFCYGIAINPALINYTANNTYQLNRDSSNNHGNITNYNSGDVRAEKQGVDLYSFALEFIESFKNKYAESTYKMLVSEINKLKRFKPSLTFDEIDYDFFSRYEIYLRDTLKNQPNTISKSLKKIQLFINIAIRKGILASNPVSYYKIKIIASKRAYLTIEELQTLEHLYNSKEINQNMSETLHCFLFACYTGLRYSDIRKLDYKDITDGCIQLTQSKTGIQVTIPLSDKAKLLINQSWQSGSVFSVCSNMKANAHLKLIIEKAGINKKVTFHTARHTFATISLNIGIPMEIVSKLLGHSDIKTTQIYAKLFEKTKFEQMEKWNMM